MRPPEEVFAPVPRASVAGGGAAEAQRRLAARFREAGIETAALDARLLVLDACGLRLEELLAEPGRPMPASAAHRLEASALRRLAGEPVARILGEKEFWGLSFRLSPETLVPRPDTEVLVEAVLAHLAGASGDGLRILDLGTGTGCLLAALLSELPLATGVGVDVSEGACRTARRNLERHGLSWRGTVLCGSWTEALAGEFDVIVANPPYVETATAARLAPEVSRFDPAAALDGGPDGLAAYRALVPQAAGLLVPGGIVALEIGRGQADAVAGLCRQAGLGPVRLAPDLAGIPRAVLARRLESPCCKLPSSKAAATCYVKSTTRTDLTQVRFQGGGSRGRRERDR